MLHYVILGYKRFEKEEDLYPGQALHQVCWEGTDGPLQRRQCEAEDLHGLIEARLQSAKHRPAVRLRGHDGCWGGPWQSARPPPELVTSHTTPGKVAFLSQELLSTTGFWYDWWLACRSSSPHLPVCWTINHVISSPHFSSSNMCYETHKLVYWYIYSKVNAVKNLL